MGDSCINVRKTNAFFVKKHKYKSLDRICNDYYTYVSKYLHTTVKYMENNKRVPRSVRREQILDAACALFAEFGFSGTTTRQLAEKVGCNETIIFRIFPSKEAIFEALFDEWKQADINPEHLEILDGSALKTLEGFYQKMLNAKHFEAGQLIRAGWRRSDLGRAVTSRNGEEKWSTAYHEVLRYSNDVVRTTIAPVIRYGQQKREIKDGDPILLAELFWCMVCGVFSVKQNYPDRYIEISFDDFVSLLTPLQNHE